MQTISGADAIYRMRNLRLVNDASFTLIHISCNLKTGECGEIVKHDRCRLRKSLGYHSLTVNLPYEDTDTGEPKMCFKKLIRHAAFPPDYELLKVSWFNE